MQGQLLPKFWKHFLARGVNIRFAHTSFNWKNLARNNAGVIVVIVGLDSDADGHRAIYQDDKKIECHYISPYLTNARVDVVRDRTTPIHKLPALVRGSIPNCGGNLVLKASERDELLRSEPAAEKFLKRYVGSQEISKGIVRYALLVPDHEVVEAMKIPPIRQRIEEVAETRAKSKKKSTREVLVRTPHRYELTSSNGSRISVAVARTTSEHESIWLPISYLLAR